MQPNKPTPPSTIWPDVVDILRRTRKSWVQANFGDAVVTMPNPDSLVIQIADAHRFGLLNGRANIIIEQAAKSVSGRQVAVSFVLKEDNYISALTDLDDESDADDADTEVIGVYHNAQNALIQPGKTEWPASQYFRKKWRPLLGPLLSELIRELRQRCHFKTQRNSFKTTYKSLAEALGVSERTIIRALGKDAQNNFKNAYFHHFIADIDTIRHQGTDGKIRNEGTRFTIYLDDPLTPNDQLKITELTK